MRRAVIGTGRFSRALSALFLAAAMAMGLLALTVTKPAGAALAVTFLPATSFAVGDSPQGIASADFNGDSKPDLAAANTNSDDVSVLLGDGTGSFGAATNFDVGTGPVGITSADFNGDGKPDLATANHHDPDPNNPEDVKTSNVSVLLGDGMGSFGTAATFSLATDSKATGITSADFDGDGRKDLAVSAPGVNDVAVLRNVTGLQDTTPSFGTPTFFFAGLQSSPFGITSADLDGDGKPDLATANLGSNKVSVLRNTTSSPGTPDFGAATPFDVDDGPFSITSADFDGDSKPDLAAADFRSNDVSVLRNTTSSPGTPSFATATNFAVGTNPRGITSVDLDGDGKLDLATANVNFLVTNVSVLLGDGTGSFGTATNFEVSGRPTSITSADFNGDTKPDLATANVSGNSVSVLLGTNALPTISDIADKTINQNTDTGDIPFTIGDTETPAESLTLSASSGNTTLVPNANIVFGAPDQPPGADRTVKVTPVANGAGTANITVTVTDADGGSSSDTFELTVLDTTPPKVTRVVPAENAGRVAPGANVSAFFSEAMRAGTINVNTVKLFKAGTTTRIGATVNYTETTSATGSTVYRVILNPNVNLRRGARYKAVVSTGTRDVAGNPLDQDQDPSNGNQPKVWFFRVRN